MSKRELYIKLTQRYIDLIRESNEAYCVHPEKVTSCFSNIDHDCNSCQREHYTKMYNNMIREYEEAEEVENV